VERRRRAEDRRMVRKGEKRKIGKKEVRKKTKTENQNPGPLDL
jgi:hypothetical protein